MKTFIVPLNFRRRICKLDARHSILFGTNFQAGSGNRPNILTRRCCFIFKKQFFQTILGNRRSGPGARFRPDWLRLAFSRIHKPDPLEPLLDVYRNYDSSHSSTRRGPLPFRNCHKSAVPRRI